MGRILFYATLLSMTIARVIFRDKKKKGEKDGEEI